MNWINETFKNPGSFYRPKPFWFWNGDITEEGIEKQIKEMYEKGIGGFYLSPRQGQSIPYLSERWFSLVRYACERAKDYGLEAWLYDEYPYPSGMGGGMVLRRHPEAEHKILCHKQFDVVGQDKIYKELENGEILYAKAIPIGADGSVNREQALELRKHIGILQTKEIYQITGLTMYNNKRFFSYGPQNVLTVTLPEGNWRIEIYYEKPMGDFKFFGGYFDPCHEGAVETFLKVTHDAYKDAFGSRLANHTKGIFSDEVGMLSPIPWSSQVPEAFERMKGYSILENLPALHDALWPGAYRIRYDLYDVVHQLFVNSYHKQVSEWCAKENILYCTEVPFMRLSTQRYSDVPGGDTGHEKAGRELEWIYNKYLCAFRYSANAVASLARQLGRKQCLIESFHSVGWSMTLQDAKWMLDRLAASGINQYIFHAFYYSIDSIHKHDAPPSQFFQNPYWKYYRKLTDYAARLSTYVTETLDATEIAVLDPVASLWAMLGNPFQGFPYEGESELEKKQCDELRNNWVYITKTLLLNQLQYNHLDSEMLADFTIKDGKMKCGNASYKIIIIPPAIFYECSAYDKLKEFVENGGYLLFLGHLPYLSISLNETDSEAKRKWEQLLEDYPKQVFEIPAEGTLETAGIEQVFINKVKVLADEPVEVIFKRESERKNFITAIRKDHEGHLFLSLINQGKEPACATVINRRKTIFVMEELCMEDGALEKFAELNSQITIAFAPYESKYFCLSARRETTIRELHSQNKKRCSSLVISSEKLFKVSLDRENVLRFASFEISRNGEDWFRSEPMTLIEQANAFPLMEKTDYRYESTFGTPKHIKVGFPVRVYYRTTFNVEALPKRAELLLDRNAVTGIYRIMINGTQLDCSKFYHRFINDEANRLLEVTQYLRPGENRLEVEVEAQKESDGWKDPMYLLGAFGVKDSHTIVALPSEARFDSRYIEGFPYFSGTMVFEQDIELDKNMYEDETVVSFDFADSCMDCLEVKINGYSLGVRAFSPYKWTCKKTWLQQGKNKIELIRTNTLANMLDGTYFDYENHKLVSI